jgi:hypothetical protein
MSLAVLNFAVKSHSEARGYYDSLQSMQFSEGVEIRRIKQISSELLVRAKGEYIAALSSGGRLWVVRYTPSDLDHWDRAITERVTLDMPAEIDASQPCATTPTALLDLLDSAKLAGVVTKAVKATGDTIIAKPLKAKLEPNKRRFFLKGRFWIVLSDFRSIQMHFLNLVGRLSDGSSVSLLTTSTKEGVDQEFAKDLIGEMEFKNMLAKVLGEEVAGSVTTEAPMPGGAVGVSEELPDEDSGKGETMAIDDKVEEPGGNVDLGEGVVEPVILDISLTKDREAENPPALIFGSQGETGSEEDSDGGLSETERILGSDKGDLGVGVAWFDFLKDLDSCGSGDDKAPRLSFPEFYFYRSRLGVAGVTDSAIFQGLENIHKRLCARGAGEREAVVLGQFFRLIIIFHEVELGIVKESDFVAAAQEALCGYSADWRDLFPAVCWFCLKNAESAGFAEFLAKFALLISEVVIRSSLRDILSQRGRA